MRIIFYGGARWVTGANYMLDSGRTKILVDCGLFQGKRYAEDLNYEPFNYDPSEISYVLITHSHIDHIGRLPKLYKDGFRGKVCTTRATSDLMAVSLADNLARITEEAEQMNHPPLFEQTDIEGVLSLIKGFEYDRKIDLENGLTVTFHDAGHILGSSIVEIKWPDRGGIKKIFFSGDLGNPPTPLLRPTEFVHGADYLVVESAYGDRIHETREKRKEKLIQTIMDTIGRKGVLMIPTFAMERTQELLYELNGLFAKKEIPSVPVFIDSPLAVKLTEVYKKHSEYFNRETAELMDQGEDIFKFPQLKKTSSADESKAINDVPPPKIIIAGSGMSHGGRIIHHEIRYLPDPNSTILFVGYQVDGSLGRHIQRGDKEVTILGQKVPVNCHIANISSYSSHADQKGLLMWVEKAKTGDKLKNVFVVQGEEISAKTLAYLIREKLGIPAVAPHDRESFEI